MPFSSKQADIACNFFQKLLKHTIDEWYGKPFNLVPWEEEAIRHIWGMLDDEGRRLTQMAYLEVPKKSGKSEWAAGLALMALLLDPNPGCQVYGAASSQKQAGNVYRAACKMVEQSSILKNELRILRGTNRIIKRRDPESFYAAIAADGDLTDGVNPSVVIADEVHRWRERKHIENWDVLTLGGITRRQALTIAITTAGVRNESPLAWRLHEKTERARDKIIDDKSFYGRIYAASPEDDWTKEETWIKAHPSLEENGGFLKLSKLRTYFEAAQTDPEAQRAWRRYFLNLWDQKENRCIPMDKWDRCKGDWTAQGLKPLETGEMVRALPDDLIGRFIDRTAYSGIDMSYTIDMTAVVFLFPAEDGFFDVMPFFWVPEFNARGDLKKREVRDGIPYRAWAEQGFIEVSPGDVIDWREIRKRLEWGARMFDLKELCFDQHNSTQISIPMREEGYMCIDIPQAFGKTEANKKFLEIVQAEKLRHGGHPVLRFNASCLTSVERDGKLKFVKPERQKDSSRIDGVDATTDALFRGMIEQPVSDYPLAIL